MKGDGIPLTPVSGPLLPPRKDFLDEVLILGAAQALLVGVEIRDAFELAYFAQHRGGELAAAQ
jgi:hypothetical protein